MSINIHKYLSRLAVRIGGTFILHCIWYNNDILSARCKSNYATECSLSSVHELGNQDNANKFPADCTSASPTSRCTNDLTSQIAHKTLGAIGLLLLSSITFM